MISGFPAKNLYIIAYQISAVAQREKNKFCPEMRSFPPKET
jgi:hypothetical protein